MSEQPPEAVPAVPSASASLGAFLSKYKQKWDQVQTHMWMSSKASGGGIVKLHVPMAERLKFYTELSQWISQTSVDDLQKPYSSDNCVTEKIHDDLFKLYLDIDFKVELFKSGHLPNTEPELKETMHRFFGIIHQVIVEYYGELANTSYLAMRVPYKFHIHYPDIVINKEYAKALIQRIKHALASDDECAHILNEDEQCIDDSVYNAGLRLLYMHKGKMGKNKAVQNKTLHKEVLPWCQYYEIYTLVDKVTFKRIPFTKDDYRHSSILLWDNTQKLSDPLQVLRCTETKPKKTKQGGWEDPDDDDDDLHGPEVLGQPSSEELMPKIRKTLTWAFKEFNHTIVENKCKINVIHNRTILLLPLTTKECTKIGRDHESNHQYLKIDMSGAKQKCFKCKITNKFVPLRLLPDNVKRELKSLKIVKEYNVVTKERRQITDEDRKVTFRDALFSESQLFPKRDLSFITSNDVIFNGASYVAFFKENWCEVCGQEHDHPSTFVEIDRNACLYARCLESIKRRDFSIYPNPPRSLHPDYRNYYIINVYVNAPNEGSNEVDLIFDKQYSFFNDPPLDELMFHALSGTTFAIVRVLHYLARDLFACTSEGRWYAYKSHRWIADQTPSLMTYISETLTNYFREVRDYYDEHVNDPDQQRRCHMKLNEIINNLSNFRFKEGLIKEAHSYFLEKDVFYKEEDDSHFEHRLDEEKHLIGFTNGVYDLDAMEFRDGKPSDCITMSTKYPYKDKPDPEIRSQIVQFFRDIQPMEDEREYMLLHLASCLHGENNQEHYHVYTGSGRNGKSKLQDLIKAVMGEYFHSAAPEFMTRDRANPEAATAAIVNLKGRRVIMVSEPNPNERFKGNILKGLTGNDYVTGRKLHSNKIVEYKPHFQLICLANDIPLMDVTDEAIFLRSRILNFPTRFTANPTEPHEKLMNESLQDLMKDWKQDFMLLLLDYYAKYKNELGKKLVPPRAVMKLVEEYNMQSNPVRQWWITCTEESPGYNTRLKSMQNKFREWYKENFNKSMDSNKFNLELSRVLTKENAVAHIYCHDVRTSQKGVPNRRIKQEYIDGELEEHDL